MLVQGKNVLHHLFPADAHSELTYLEVLLYREWMRKDRAAIDGVRTSRIVLDRL